jgi:hypothetical protein
MKRTPDLHIVVRTPHEVLLDTRARQVEVYGADDVPLILTRRSGPLLEALADARIVLRQKGRPGRAVEMSWGTLTVAGGEVRIAARDAEVRALGDAGAAGLALAS